MLSLALMGKQRGKPEPEGPEPSRRVTVLTIRGTPEWRAWLDRAAKFCRINTSSLVDVAVAKYAREQGFTEPPPDR